MKKCLEEKSVGVISRKRFLEVRWNFSFHPEAQKVHDRTLTTRRSHEVSFVQLQQQIERDSPEVYLIAATTCLLLDPQKHTPSVGSINQIT
jgi:hypothetical protein